LQSLGQGLISEQAAVLREVEGLSGNIGHIKEIVARQQSYAKVSNVLEVQSVPALLEDALQLSADMLARHQIQVARQFDDVPEVLVDKHKVLEILVNLVSNAKQAMSSNAAGERRLTLRVGGQPGDLVGISVADNGIGIPPENLTSIFSHGFTTKKDGHGFGLHSAAIFAREMGGSLRVHSDGPGKGARFTLELPVRPPEAASTPDTRHPTLGLESIIARPQ
jgi:signal transduction histidine kinase